MIELVKGLLEEGIKEIKKYNTYEPELYNAVTKIADATIIEIICKKIETELYNKGKYNKKAINELIDYISNENVRRIIRRRIKEIK